MYRGQEIQDRGITVVVVVYDCTCVVYRRQEIQDRGITVVVVVYDCTCVQG